MKLFYPLLLLFGSFVMGPILNFDIFLAGTQKSSKMQKVLVLKRLCFWEVRWVHSILLCLDVMP